jgi:hypothetical protein
MPPAKATGQSLTRAFFIPGQGVGRADSPAKAGPTPFASKERTWPTNI